MTILWIMLGFTLGLAIAIMRNTDDKCRESKGIITGGLLGSSIWILTIILVNAWCK